MTITRYNYFETKHGNQIYKAMLLKDREKALILMKAGFIQALENYFAEIPKGIFNEHGFCDGFNQGLVSASSNESGWSLYDTVNCEYFTGVLEEVTIDLMANELEAAYNEMQHKYLLDEAKTRFLEYLSNVPGITSSALKAVPGDSEFDAYLIEYCGFTCEEALDPKSQNYVLEKLVKLFQDKANVDRDDYGAWMETVKDFIESAHEINEFMIYASMTENLN